MAQSDVVIQLAVKNQKELERLQGQMKKLEAKVDQLNGKLPRAANNIRRTGRAAATATANVQRFGIAFRSVLGPLVGVFGALNLVNRSLRIAGQRQADTAALTNGLQKLGATEADLKRLQKAADELGKQTLFNENDFRQAFTLLTSFRTIAVGTYERVTTVAADMAQVLGQDVKSVMLQVAKALEAPEVGLTALQRSGTRFTEQQKEQVKAMVKAGQLAEAQRFILKELETQYGNAAKKAGKAGFAGAVDGLAESFDDFSEKLGSGIEPAVNALLGTLTKFFEVVSAIPQPVGQFALAVGGVTLAVVGLTGAINALLGTKLAVWLATQAGLIAAYGAKMYLAVGAVNAMIAAQKALAIAMALTPWGAVAAAVAALGVVTFNYYNKQRQLKAILNGSIKDYNQVKKAVEAKKNEYDKAAKKLDRLTKSSIINRRAMAAQKLRVAELKKELEALNGVLDKLDKESGGNNDPDIPYVPTGGGGGDDKKANKEQAESVLRTLRQQLAAAKAKEGIDSEILRISQQYSDNMLQISQLEDQSLVKQQTEAALQLRNAQISKVTQAAAEKRAKAVGDVVQGLDRQLAGLQAVTAEQKRELEVQDIIKRLQDAGVTLTEKEIELIRTKLGLLDQEKQKRDEIAFQQKIAEEALNATGKKLTGLIDALIQGTDNWRQTLTNTLRQLSSMLLSLGIKSLAGTDGEGFFSFLDGSLNLGKRASGGPVSSNSPYIVGERGPELFVPSSSGNIVPNNELGGGVNSVVNVTINSDGTSQTDASRATKLGRMVEASVMGVLNRERRPGGVLSR